MNATARDLQQSAIRRFRNVTGNGVCVLCGLPAKRAYCHAHSWAFGTEDETTATAGTPNPIGERRRSQTGER